MANTVTSKGQVTIPKPVRDRLQIRPGSEVEFVLEADGRVVLVGVAEGESRSRFAHLVGSGGPGMSTDEIMALTRGEE
jgi:AbrB family looped-hinge helix DNA binding protein